MGTVTTRLAGCSTFHSLLQTARMFSPRRINTGMVASSGASFPKRAQGCKLQDLCPPNQDRLIL